jgi:hypothetical protein
MLRRKSRHSPLALLLAAGIVAPACADEDDVPDEPYQPTVETEINPDVDFSQYSSFDVIDPEAAVDGDPPPEFAAYQQQINDSVIAELRGEGLTHDPDDPQLLVNPFVSIEAATGAYTFYDAYWGWYYGYEYLWTLRYDYTDGSLMFDVVDRGDPDDIADDVLVYRGVAVGLLGEDPEIIKLQIRNATRAIFADWPGGESQ